jgi:hypothetical protein
LIRYKVKPGEQANNEALVRKVYDELGQAAPDGFRYATFVLEDGVSFVHIAATEATDGSSPLPGLAAFQAFQDGIAERCDEPPTPAPLREVGSYAFWDHRG